MHLPFPLFPLQFQKARQITSVKIDSNGELKRDGIDKTTVPESRSDCGMMAMVFNRLSSEERVSNLNSDDYHRLCTQCAIIF